MICLTYVTNRCINMTYRSRQRCPESQASEPRSGLVAAVRSTARRRGAIGARLCHLSTASLSIPPAGRALESASPSERIQAGVHGEAPTQFDSAGAVVRICQEDLDQRSREPGTVGAPATRGRSWLSPSRLRHGPFSLEYRFDRLLPDKLAQAYQLLVPDRRRNPPDAAEASMFGPGTLPRARWFPVFRMHCG